MTQLRPATASSTADTVYAAGVRWALFWIVAALLFNGGLWCHWYWQGSIAIANKKASEFFIGYLIEKILSVDNLFTFYLIFDRLHIPLTHQQIVLFFGVWSAIIMRILLIVSGIWLIAKIHWIIYLMGGLLLLVGMKTLLAQGERKTQLANSVFFDYLIAHMRVLPKLSGYHFFVKQGGLWYATPLFAALVLVEVSDLVFALDSIPAIFAITHDPFIIWTSNVFAILGLRSLYLLLSGVIKRLHWLQYAIAMILVFIGSKMLLDYWFEIPIWLSLLAIVLIIGIFGCVNLTASRTNLK